MYCRKCGKSIPDDSVFCPYCGEPVIHDEQSEDSNPENKAAEKSRSEPEITDIQTESAKFGRCENCGKPLESDGGALCKDCSAELLSKHVLTVKDYPYGSCGKCGGPLQQDDMYGICKNCLLNSEYEAKKAAGEIDIEKSHKHKMRFGLVIIALVFAFIVFAILASSAVSMQNATTGTTCINSRSSAVSVESPNISSVKTGAKELAVSWAMENMQHYGNISDGTFSESTGPHSYTLRYDYRAPNAYSAKEEHVLFLIYTEKNSDWQLHAATSDGDALQINNK